MKAFFNKIGNNKLLLIFALILQIIIVILIINPFSIIAANQQKAIVADVVTLANDPDFRNASIVQISDAEAFKTEYLLDEKFNEIQNNDYFLLANSKLIVYRADEKKIVIQSEAPYSMLNLNRLNNLIFSKTKDKNLIKEDEQPVIKLYNSEIDSEKYKDYFENLQNGDVLAFFLQNKKIVLFNLKSGEISQSKDFELK